MRISNRNILLYFLINFLFYSKIFCVINVLYIQIGDRISENRKNISSMAEDGHLFEPNVLGHNSYYSNTH